jgi:hypothetical protein
MTHLLIDVDSKIPNLALMKISQYIKRNGGVVQLVTLHGKTRLLPPGPSRLIPLPPAIAVTVSPTIAGNERRSS